MSQILTAESSDWPFVKTLIAYEVVDSTSTRGRINGGPTPAA
jgi:hypothetical protein